MGQAGSRCEMVYSCIGGAGRYCASGCPVLQLVLERRPTTTASCGQPGTSPGMMGELMQTKLKLGELLHLIRCDLAGSGAHCLRDWKFMVFLVLTYHSVDPPSNPPASVDVTGIRPGKWNFSSQRERCDSHTHVRRTFKPAKAE